jgi:hypothetical protein
VYELKKVDEYPMVDFLHKITSERSLAENEWISIDYPADMKIKKTKEFIEKSIQNNYLYKDYDKYICTIQSGFRSVESFIKRADELRDIWSKEGKIIGIGNMCRILTTSKNHRYFLENVFEYIKTEMAGKRVHFYGLAKQLIVKYVPMLEKKKIEVSVDSTKWTRCDEEYKLKHGVCARSHNRDDYLLRYMKGLENKGIKVEW